MAQPLNHAQELATITREHLARRLGQMVIEQEREHYEQMAILAGGSVRSFCRARPALNFVAIHKALGW